MADINTDEQFNVVLAITNASGNPALVDGVPMWATSDATVLGVTASADGMSAVVPCLTAIPDAQRITVTADADLGAGVVTIRGVSEDINCTQGTANQARTMTLTLGAPVPKAPIVTGGVRGKP